jgi:hypothetical protein
MYFHPRARFAVVVTGHRSNISDFVRKCIDMLSSRFKLKTIIVVPNSNKSQYGINENVHGLL